MTLESGKALDRLCVIDWLNEIYVNPGRAFDSYTDKELKEFAHDAIFLLLEKKEKEKKPDVVYCKDCKHWVGNRYKSNYSSDNVNCVFCHYPQPSDWYCADGERL